MWKIAVVLCLLLFSGFVLAPIQRVSFFAYMVLSQMLYGAVVYLLVALVFRLRPPRAAVVAVVLCVALELFKLTGIPAQMWAFPPAHAIFGTTFSVTHLLSYPIGILLMSAVDRKWLRRSRAG